MATVTMSSEAREDFSELPRTIALRVENLLDRLRNWPSVSGVKRLRGDLAGKCRMRTGDYRLQFRVEEKKKLIKDRVFSEYYVIVEKIGHRDGFYEE